MRIDFREERRWKIAVAYNLGTAVLEWHAAGSLAERVRRGISVLWKRPHIDESEMEDTQPEPDEAQMEVDDNAAMQDRSNPLSLIDYGSDDDDEQEKDQQSVIDALDTAAMIEEALEKVEAQNAEQGGVEPKVEDLEDTLALRSDTIDEGANLMDVDVPEDSQEGAEAAKRKQEEEVPLFSALKPTSTDPILTNISPIEGEASASASRPNLKANVYAPLREKIAYSDDTKLFLDLDDLILSHNFSTLSTNDTTNEEPPPAPDLSAIFPDLQPFALLDVPSPVVISTSSEGRRRSERKDKDDPNKRAEDTTYSKLTPIGQFMRCKPTLIGPLQPSKRWKNGQWSNVDEAPVVVEYESPLARMGDDTNSGKSSSSD
jgi:chromatin modification-related protein VID21